MNKKQIFFKKRMKFNIKKLAIINLLKIKGKILKIVMILILIINLKKYLQLINQMSQVISIKISFLKRLINHNNYTKINTNKNYKIALNKKLQKALFKINNKKLFV